MRKAVFFILDSASLLIRPRVWSVSGLDSESTSLSRSSSSKPTQVTPGTSFFVRLHAMTFMPNACAICAVRRPILPRPKMPIVLPASSISGLSQ